MPGYPAICVVLRGICRCLLRRSVYGMGSGVLANRVEAISW